MVRLEQKLMGIGLILLGILSTIVLDGDGTAALLLVPAGISAIFTKKNLFNYYDEEGTLE